MKNPYAQRLRELRVAAGKNFTELAKALGVTRQAVANWENPEANAPSTKNLGALAETYGLPVSDLTKVVSNSPPGDSYSRVADARLIPFEQNTDPVISDVPLMGVAVGGADGEFAFNGDVISLVPRPSGLKHARGVFAVHVLSDSMAPRFEPGEMIYASSALAPVPGDDVIVEMHPREGSAEMPAYIKRLVRRTHDTLVCRQFNPPEEISFPLAHVARVHRVLRTRELVGA